MVLLTASETWLAISAVDILMVEFSVLDDAAVSFWNSLSRKLLCIEGGVSKVRFEKWK